MGDDHNDEREKNGHTDNDPEQGSKQGGSTSDDAHAPGMGEENKRPDDTLADEKKCPECGEPVDDVRATCINCGYEYKDEDHEDPEAGSEFVTGSQIDDEGNELPDEEPPPDSKANAQDGNEADDNGNEAEKKDQG